MPRYAHPDVLDNGLAYIKTNCNKLALISAYTIGDSYAVVSAAILADAVMAPADFTLASSGLDRTLTPASGKSDAAANASGGGANMHIAYLDTLTSKVLLVTEETSDQAITAGNPVTFPGPVYTARQPTA